MYEQFLAYLKQAHGPVSIQIHQESVCNIDKLPCSRQSHAITIKLNHQFLNCKGRHSLLAFHDKSTGGNGLVDQQLYFGSGHKIPRVSPETVPLFT